MVPSYSIHVRLCGPSLSDLCHRGVAEADSGEGRVEPVQPSPDVERLLRPSRKAAWSSRYFRQMAQGERLCQVSGQTCPRRLAPYRVLAELVLPRAPFLFLVLLCCVLLSGPDHEQTVSWAHLHPPQAL